MGMIQQRRGLLAFAVLLACLWCVQGVANDRVIYPFYEGQGEIIANPPGWVYPNNTTVELTAQPATGWAFVSWVFERMNPNTTPDDPLPEGHEVRVRNSPIWAPRHSTDNPESVTMRGMNAKVTVKFERLPVDLVVSVVGQGSVDVDPAAPYLFEDEVTLTAVPEAGWEFTGWSGALSGDDNPAVLTLDDPSLVNEVTATFERIVVSLTVATQGSGSVNLSAAAPYYWGDQVTLTAVPSSGWDFARWEGALTGSANPDALTLTADADVTAIFGQPVSLVLGTIGQGAIDADPDGPYLSADTVTLTGLPEAEWEFSHWTVTDIFPPTKATSPNPAHGATGVNRGAFLYWTDGNHVHTNHVHYGTSTNPPLVAQVPAGVQEYNTGVKNYNTLYYWRINGEGLGGTAVGDVWSFRTETDTSCSSGALDASTPASRSISLAMLPLLGALVALGGWMMSGKRRATIATLLLIGALLLSGTASAQFTENPLALDMDNANGNMGKHVVGTFTKPVALTINIVGQGAYVLDPPPPYISGDQVTISFTPGSGKLMTTGQVRGAAEDDPNAGWVFSHWSDSPGIAMQFRPGLENPVTLTLTQNTTLWATFVEKGSTAHPTVQQENELMAIARGNFVPWSGLTAQQSAALLDKMNHVLVDEKEHYEWWGQIAGGVWFNDFDRTLPAALDKIGEGMTWTGMFLGGLAMKHAVMPDCQETLDAINVSLDAIDKCSWVTGTPGRMARFSGPADNAPYGWYISGLGTGAVQAYPSAAPYTGEVWLSYPTRDTHTGVFFGLGSVLHYVQDQATWDKARMLTERIIDQLVADGWVLRDGFRSEANSADLRQMQERVAYKANPVKYASFLSRITGYAGLTPDVRHLYHSDYWVPWMGWARAHIITLLEWDPTRLANYRNRMVNRYNSDARRHMNPWFAAVATFHDNGNLAPDAYATLQGFLLTHPDFVKRYWRSELLNDPRYTQQNATHTNEAAIASHRMHDDFDGMRSAARTMGRDNSFGYTYSSWELIVYYWMGRVSGAIPGPGAAAPAMAPMTVTLEGDDDVVDVTILNPSIALPESLPAGETTFRVTNTSGKKYDIAVLGEGLDTRLGLDLPAGESMTVTLDLPVGEYFVYLVGEDGPIGLGSTVVVFEAEASEDVGDEDDEDPEED